MRAKEMFEKLGYELKQGVDFLLYVLESEENPDIQYYIEFETDVKTIIIDTNRKDFINDITIKELQAINKQVEELGWLDNER